MAALEAVVPAVEALVLAAAVAMAVEVEVSVAAADWVVA